MKTIIIALLFSAFALGQSYETHSYGEHSQQIYDVYFPDNYNEQTPVVIFIHGGGWWAPGVQRSRYRPFVEGLFSMGEMIVVNMDYRLVTNGGDIYVFPHQIEDITSVINHVESEYNLNNPITLTGNSAGGHLSLWYYLNQVTEIEKIIPIVPPYKADVMVGDIPYFLHPSNTLLDWVIEQFVSPEITFDTELEKLLYTSPHTYANQELDDIFAVFCTSDRDVPLHQYEAMQQDYPNIQYQLYGGGHNAWTNTNNAVDLIPKMKAFIFQQPEETECVLPTVLEMTRTSHTTATVSFENGNFQYQGSANRAGRPLRPYPMYGMDNMNQYHTQSALVPAFDYDVWFRTICGDGTYSEWTEAHYLPRFEGSKVRGNYYNINGVFMGNEYEQLPRGYYIKNNGQESIKIYKK